MRFPLEAAGWSEVKHCKVQEVSDEAGKGDAANPVIGVAAAIGPLGEGRDRSWAD